MRIHVSSDLNLDLEFAKMEFSPEVRAGTLAELVLLAGDIDARRRAPIWAAQTFSQPVAMSGGNHEAYGDGVDGPCYGIDVPRWASPRPP
jgi:hypothetical protein